MSILRTPSVATVIGTMGALLLPVPVIANTITGMVASMMDARITCLSDAGVGRALRS